MPEFVFENLSVFPYWLQLTLITLWGIFLAMVPLHGIVKILQSRSLKSFVDSIKIMSIKLGEFLSRQIDDPIKFPKIERFFRYAMVLWSYIVAGTLFLHFVIIVVLWRITDKQLSLGEHVAILLFSLLCVYMTAVLKAQGNRELLKLRADV